MIHVLRKGSLTAVSQLELLQGKCSPYQSELHVSSWSAGGNRIFFPSGCDLLGNLLHNVMVSMVSQECQG